MKLIDNILYIEFQEAIESGVSDSALRKSKLRNSSSATFQEDPDDNRKVLIEFESLKERYKQAIIDRYGNPYEYVGNNLLRKHLVKDFTSLKGLKEHILPTGEGIPEAKILHYSLACDLLHLLNKCNKSYVKRIGFDSVNTVYKLAGHIIERDNLPLPASYSKLKRKLKLFNRDGYKAVISSKFGNNNTTKITGEVYDWLIAQYAQPIKIDTTKLWTMYKTEAQKLGWPQLSESGIYRFVNRDEIRPIWWMGRHGKSSWKSEFGHTMHTFLPRHRDAIWCVDGTKLNLYHKDPDSGLKMAAKLKIIKVTDVATETILGYDISLQEDHVSVYKAFKNAVRNTGRKPYQVLYDKGSGFMKSEIQGLMTRISSVHFNARPHTPQAKPVESLIGRFQKQVMRDLWYFTGQNVDNRRREDSRENKEFIIKNRAYLPTIKQICDVVVPNLIERWNNSKHPKIQQPRLEEYRNSANKFSEEITYLDMIDVFWLFRKDTIKYYPNGLKMEIAKKEYKFEVYEEDGKTPKASFLEKYTKASFYIKYDPEDLSHIRLYQEDEQGDLRFIDAAHNVNRVARFVGDLTPGMHAEIKNNMQFRDDQVDRVERELNEIREKSSVDPETLISIGYLGDDKDAMNDAESLYLINNQPEEDDDILQRM